MRKMRAGLIVLTIVGCSSHSAGSDGNGDGIVDVPPQVTGRFPLHVSADGGSLVADDGTPFLLHGEAAWSALVQLPDAQLEAYLADRASRGVDALLVNLIEHQFATNPPASFAGDQPFTTANDFTRPNPAYFAHADDMIDRAAAHGFAVMLFPAYLGFNGGNEGWFAAMQNLSAAQCRQYGDMLGARYAQRTNIIWMWGGDFTPPSGSAGEACMKAIADGIHAAEPTALRAAHWMMETSSLDEPLFASSVDLVGVYTYAQPDLALCRSTRARTPRRPTFLMETTYENVSPATVADVRQQQWWGALGCGGEISGNLPLWKFPTNWQQQLDSPLSRQQMRIPQILTPLAWPTFALDDALVTAGRGTGAASVVAARSSDGTTAVVYIPPTGAASITADLTMLSGPASAVWFDPTAGASMPAGSALTGSHVFATPGPNAAGDGDWVLVLISQ